MRLGLLSRFSIDRRVYAYMYGVLLVNACANPGPTASRGGRLRDPKLPGSDSWEKGVLCVWITSAFTTAVENSNVHVVMLLTATPNFVSSV